MKNYIPFLLCATTFVASLSHGLPQRAANPGDEVQRLKDENVLYKTLTGGLGVVSTILGGLSWRQHQANQQLRRSQQQPPSPPRTWLGTDVPATAAAADGDVPALLNEIGQLRAEVNSLEAQLSDARAGRPSPAIGRGPVVLESELHSARLRIDNLKQLLRKLEAVLRKIPGGAAMLDPDVTWFERVGGALPEGLEDDADVMRCMANLLLLRQKLTLDGVTHVAFTEWEKDLWSCHANPPAHWLADELRAGLNLRGVAEPDGVAPAALPPTPPPPAPRLPDGSGNTNFGMATSLIRNPKRVPALMLQHITQGHATRQPRANSFLGGGRAASQKGGLLSGGPGGQVLRSGFGRRP